MSLRVYDFQYVGILDKIGGLGPTQQESAVGLPLPRGICTHDINIAKLLLCGGSTRASGFVVFVGGFSTTTSQGILCVRNFRPMGVQVLVQTSEGVILSSSRFRGPGDRLERMFPKRTCPLQRGGSIPL